MYSDTRAGAVSDGIAEFDGDAEGTADGTDEADASALGFTDGDAADANDEGCAWLIHRERLGNVVETRVNMPRATAPNTSVIATRNGQEESQVEADREDTTELGVGACANSRVPLLVVAAVDVRVGTCLRGIESALSDITQQIQTRNEV